MKKMQTRENLYSRCAFTNSDVINEINEGDIKKLNQFCNFCIVIFLYCFQYFSFFNVLEFFRYLFSRYSGPLLVTALPVLETPKQRCRHHAPLLAGVIRVRSQSIFRQRFSNHRAKTKRKIFSFGTTL